MRHRCLRGNSSTDHRARSTECNQDGNDGECGSRHLNSGRCVYNYTHPDDTDAKTDNLDTFVTMSQSEKEADEEAENAKTDSFGIRIPIEV